MSSCSTKPLPTEAKPHPKIVFSIASAPHKAWMTPENWTLSTSRARHTFSPPFSSSQTNPNNPTNPSTHPTSTGGSSEPATTICASRWTPNTKKTFSKMSMCGKDWDWRGFSSARLKRLCLGAMIILRPWSAWTIARRSRLGPGSFSFLGTWSRARGRTVMLSYYAARTLKKRKLLRLQI